MYRFHGAAEFATTVLARREAFDPGSVPAPTTTSAPPRDLGGGARSEARRPDTEGRRAEAGNPRPEARLRTCAAACARAVGPAVPGEEWYEWLQGR